jgi:hypothetical protein
VNERQHFNDFADIRDGIPLEGRKRKTDEILNIEVLITGYRIVPSKKNAGQCLTLQFEINNEKQIIFTGSEVLICLIERYKEKIPFYTKIIKVNRYFTFS